MYLGDNKIPFWFFLSIEDISDSTISHLWFKFDVQYLEA
jgi:hypothetical protein